jgi:hypothetical protein
MSTPPKRRRPKVAPSKPDYFSKTTEELTTEFSTKNKQELIQFCKEYKIKGYSNKKKSDIMNTIINHFTSQPEQTPEEPVQPTQQISKNAATARRGFDAENQFCKSPEVFTALEKYFGKPIQKIEKAPPRKKCDIIVSFTDGQTVKIQNKDGKGGGRGWSADRRNVDKYDLDENGKLLLKNVCLKLGTTRPEVNKSETLVSNLLLGENAEYAPTHFTHTEFNETTNQLTVFSICTATELIGELNGMAYDKLEAKRTCVHINPLMYLQRKGGGSSDHAPNDIQLKIKSFPDTIYTKLYSISETK